MSGTTSEATILPSKCLTAAPPIIEKGEDMLRFLGRLFRYRRAELTLFQATIAANIKATSNPGGLKLHPLGRRELLATFLSVSGGKL